MRRRWRHGARIQCVESLARIVSADASPSLSICWPFVLFRVREDLSRSLGELPPELRESTQTKEKALHRTTRVHHLRLYGSKDFAWGRAMTMTSTEDVPPRSSWSVNVIGTSARDAAAWVSYPEQEIPAVYVVWVRRGDWGDLEASRRAQEKADFMAIFLKFGFRDPSVVHKRLRVGPAAQQLASSRRVHWIWLQKRHCP